MYTISKHKGALHNARAAAAAATIFIATHIARVSAWVVCTLLLLLSSLSLSLTLVSCSFLASGRRSVRRVASYAPRETWAWVALMEQINFAFVPSSVKLTPLSAHVYNFHLILILYLCDDALEQHDVCRTGRDWWIAERFLLLKCKRPCMQIFFIVFPVCVRHHKNYHYKIFTHLFFPKSLFFS